MFVKNMKTVWEEEMTRKQIHDFQKPRIKKKMIIKRVFQRDRRHGWECFYNYSENNNGCKCIYGVWCIYRGLIVAEKSSNP